MDKVTAWTIVLIAGVIGTLVGLKPAIDWLDLKLVVVSPTATMPSGSTMVISGGGPGFTLIDSVEAYCKRCYASPTIWCKQRELDRLSKYDRIRWTLPFSEMLFRMTGASVEEWQRKEAEQDGSI